MTTMTRKPRPVTMWAVVRNTGRSEWIDERTVRCLKWEAWQAYCDCWAHPKYAEQHKRRKEVRLARVRVEVVNQAQAMKG